MTVATPDEARGADGFHADLATRRAGFTPGLRFDAGGRAHAVASIWAAQLATLEERLNLAPDKHGLALLSLVGVDLLPAQAARAIVVLEAVTGSVGGRAPTGARVGAHIPESDGPLPFEIEHTIAVPDTRLVEVVSIDPASGTTADHSAALARGESFTLFAPPTPIAHEIYLGHDALLAMAGRTTVDIDVALRVTASVPLALDASWWDGERWRQFAPFANTGAPGDEDSVDGTNGLTTSGTMRLFTPCGAARRLSIRGIDTHWLRLSLARPLPGRPAVRLPEVARLLLRSVVQRRRVVQTVAVQPAGPPQLTVALWDAEGQPLPELGITMIDRLSGVQKCQKTVATTNDAPAQTTFGASAGQSYALAVEEEPEPEDYLELIDGAGTSVRVDLALQRGLLPDAAIGDGRPLDITKAFLPLGPSPTVGAALYLACDEPFALPEAEVAIELTRAVTAQEEAAKLENTARTAQEETAEVESAVEGQTAPNLASARLAWEYFDGSRWRTLIAPSKDPVPNLGASGRLRFRVPTDWAPSAVAGDTRRWLRARLDAGSYAHLRLVSWTGPKNTNYLPVIEPRPPLLNRIEVFYSAASRTVPPERCLTLNDSQWSEQPAAADMPGPGWLPFRLSAESGPTLYLGFDAPLPADRIGLYADLISGSSVSALSPVWEAWDGEAWRRIAVVDGTRGLRTTGVVYASFPSITEPGTSLLPRFGTGRSWLRVRFDQQAEPPPLALAGFSAHATTALQVETIRDEIIGSSDGTPNQIHFLGRRPVLEGEAIAVRELDGPRAEVELPLLRAELAASDNTSEPQVMSDPLSGRPHEVWVTWRARPSLAFSGPTDRHYAIDRAGGRVFFGDGRHGRIPPAGPDGLRASWYRTGGGTQGNVPPGAINSVLSGIAAGAVRNPRASEGGADAEPMRSVARRGAAMLRHRRQAVTAADYEAIAAEASPAVARVRALGAVDGTGRSAAGAVRLAIVPYGREARPLPSDGLRRRVWDFVTARAPASLAGALTVTGPRYLPVGVDATVRPSVADDVGAVRDAVLAQLDTFLHPLLGGPRGEGWTFGRGPFLSDVAGVLEGVSGVDALTELAFVIAGAPSGDRVDAAPDQLVCAGPLRVATAGTGG